jgi:cell division protein ZapD
VIYYEYPLNERVRAWLRLEDLFDKTRFFIAGDDARHHHAALLSMFELIDMAARADLKSEMLQELERQKNALESLRSNPAVDGSRLRDILARIGSAMVDMHAMTGKTGQHVRDSEWLMGIKGRVALPGGVCSFDLPTYQYWLNQPAEVRRTDLNSWMAPLLPLQAGVEVVMQLLRESGHASKHQAIQGLFQLMLGGRVAQLIRVGVAPDIGCAPEVSANKYAVNIRFMSLDTLQKPRTCDKDLDFQLVFCNF